MFTWAGGKKETIDPKPTPIPDAILQAKQRFGLTIEMVTPILAEKYQLAQEQGLFISSVDRDSVGARAGLRPGDVIVQLGRYRINTLNDFAALVQRLPESASVRVAVVRGNEIGVGTLSF